jgi:hypothetical protein
MGSGQKAAVGAVFFFSGATYLATYEMVRSDWTASAQAMADQNTERLDSICNEIKRLDGVAGGSVDLSRHHTAIHPELQPLYDQACDWVVRER